MKKIIISLSVLTLFLAGTALAAMNMMTGNKNDTSVTIATQETSTPTIASALQDIYASQNISSSDQIDCLKVTDVQFEKLGDAYMGNGITEAQHTAMENMMGGEGSATVKQAHISMGRAYIGCWSGYAMSMRPMMSMMSNSWSANSYLANKNLHGGMMNWGLARGDYYGEFNVMGWITMILVWVLLVVGILALWKHIKGRNK